jgi:hypothetical protein
MQDDMTVEPRTPYTFGEWVFDLSYDDEDLPSQQFRCVTVYGVTDLNDGEDCDIGEDYDNIIDSEVMYQLNEVFNPWDLRQAVGAWSWADYEMIYVDDLDPPDNYPYTDGTTYTDPWGYRDMRDYWPGKWTERWVQFETGDDVEDEFWLEQQIVVPNDGPWPDWDEYCSAREKVLVDGVLQVPGEDEDYELIWTWNITETVAEGPMDIEDGDFFQLMYPRIVIGSETVNVTIDDVTTTLLAGREYDLDTSNGKLYIWIDMELEADDELEVDYALFFPATYIDFYEESVPEEDAHIKILYSTFHIVYKVDKFIYGIDGFMEENGVVVFPEDSDYLYLRYGPVVWFDFVRYAYDNWITVLVNGTVNTAWEWSPYSQMHYGIDSIWVGGMELGYNDVIEVTYPIFAGRWEWTTVGAESAAVDSASASMVTEGFRQWKNHDTKLASLDFQDPIFAPEEPYIFRSVSGSGEDREDYYDDQMAQTVEESAGRVHLKDDWCTTLPISSSNIIVVGGPFANLAAEYFNDFTDVYVPRIGGFQPAFTSSACWNRTSYEAVFEEGEQVTGYAVISTYKDLNGTIGFIVYGWTGQDTYYACYALQHGLLEIMQWLQPGVTSLLLEFDYTVHPAEDCFFHVVECLGTFTECSGFEYEVMWDKYVYDDEMIFKLVMNSYSSEFWVFHTYVDYDVTKPWHLPYTTAIEVTYPQYIYFHWESKIHPDP